MPAARLVLVRHGESTWNAEGRLQGQADPPLSEAGRRQVEALVPMLPGIVGGDGATAWTSDLRRASESAELLGWGGARPNPAWRELDLGEWTGLLSADVRAAEGDAFRAWREGRRPPPGGEAPEAFVARVAAAGRALLEREGTHLVICHGGPIRAACSALLGIELRRLAGVGNASVTVLESAPGGIRLLGYNLGGAGGEDLGA